MAVTGSCHCGAVRIEAPAAPEWAAGCNCSICRKLGWLVAYFSDDGSVRIEGDTVEYITGHRMIAFHHCPTCGCTTHWSSLGESLGRVGINARLLDGFAIREGVCGPDYRMGDEVLEVRLFDNAG